MADAAQRPAALAGCAALGMMALVLAFDLGGLSSRLREASFDYMLGLSQPQRLEEGVLVVDIDRESLAARGAWPWRRGLIADLVERVQAGNPSAIGIDILLRGEDRRAPGAILRTIAAETGRSDLTEIAKALPDDDAKLATILPQSDVVIGLALDPQSADPPPFPASILSKGSLGSLSLRASAGVAAPLSSFADATAASGVISLQAGVGDLVRDVPMFALGGKEVFAGLSLEVLRVGQGASAFLVDEDRKLRIGALAVPFPDDGLMRLHLSDPSGWTSRTIRAEDVLSDATPSTRFTGKMVLIGSSAPEAGARLATPVDPLTPTVQIHAEAIEQLRAGEFLAELSNARSFETGAGLALGLIAVAAAVYLTPLLATTVFVVLSLCWAAAMLGLSIERHLLIDPIGPLIPSLVGANVAALVLFARTRRMRQAIERKFARYVSPEVVRRLTNAPEELKIEGEIREVTALFSDIEGFTTMTERAEPRALVAALDAYFEGVCSIIIEHGGMVDKLVGDAAHGLFNAPLDLKDHAVRAMECAIAIDTFARAFREREGPKALGFGRTRIGFETGPVIVGDVGGLGHLDYTAHGDAVNSAARLEALNKQFGSTVAIGPRAAAAIGAAAQLRSLGHVTLRGRSGASLVRTVWANEAPDWRQRYETAFALIETNPGEALALFQMLAADNPADPVTAYWVRTLESLATPA